VTRRGHGPHCDVDLIHWSRYLDGEFSSAKCRQCEAHLADCDECREKLRDLRRVVVASRSVARESMPASVKAAMRKQARALIKGAR